MAARVAPLRSLSARITLAVLGIFFCCLGAILFYLGQSLRADMEEQLSSQQFSTVSIVGNEINEELEMRVEALQKVAGSSERVLRAGADAMQVMLSERPGLQAMFNGGVIAYSLDGVAIADFPVSVGRRGLNYMDVDVVAAALREGRSTIGKPILGKKLHAPVFGIAVPILDAQGKVIGALAGVTNLGEPNFLDEIARTGYGKTGGYLLVAPQYRMIVTATDKRRSMETLPAPGINPGIDRAIAGFEGSMTLVNPFGVQQLVSIKKLPAAGWYLALTTPTEEAFALIRKTQQRLLLVFITMAFMVSGFVWWMLRRQFAPMKRASAMLDEMTHGASEMRTLPIVRDDEVGQLIAGFNSVLGELGQRELSLRDNQILLQEMEHTAQVGGWKLDVASGKLSWTAEVYRIHETPPDFEPSVEVAIGFYVGESRVAIERMVNEAIRFGTPFDAPLLIETAKGRHRWVQSNGKAQQENGRTISVSGTFQDITLRKEMENALLESVRFNQQVIASVREGIIVYGLDLRYQVWNDYMANFTGMTARDVVGRHPLEVFPFLKDSGVMTMLEAALQGTTPETVEFPFEVKQTGRSGWASDKTAPLRNSSGEIIGVIATVADITKVKLAEQSLREINEALEERVAARTRDLAVATQQAESANLAKSVFLANMSHEIRTPLNAVMGMVHLIRRDGVSPRQAERLDKIDAAGQHLLDVINAILDLSKIEAGKFDLEEVEVRVGAIAANVGSILFDRAQAKGLMLTVMSRPMPLLRGDATRIQQALLNYATNAIKFTESGSVTIRTRVEAESDDEVLVRFEVQDTGVGVDPAAAERLFMPFEQADNSTSRNYGGTGLGLAITRKIASLMGGQAGVDSAPGHGSTFWFTARLRKSVGVPREVAAASNESAEAILRRDYADRRILVVDDEVVNREILVELLKYAGQEIDIAGDGLEAVELARTHTYDLILMDMQMPKMDGVEATRQIRMLSGGASIPILASTANVFAEDRARCLDAGMNDFVIKPVVPEDLFAAVLKWLAKNAPD